ncbi:MAG: acylneuraminate cytidylyltransferase family protein [Ilumatobacteraceae bacterium]
MIGCIAIIPARGGSKGIPHKNLETVSGKTLVARAIEAAIECPSITRIVVTSDDQSILDEAQRFDVETVRRPEEIANDDSPIESAIMHALAESETIALLPKTLALLQPTSPLRDPMQLENAIRFFAESGEYGALFGVIPAEHHPSKMLIRIGSIVEPFTTAGDLSAPRQQLPDVVRQSGSIYIADVDRFRVEQTLFLPPVGWVEVDEFEAIDIDQPPDLARAQETARLLGR